MDGYAERIRKLIAFNHSRKGKKFSETHRKNISLSHKGVNKGDKNGMWRGDQVGKIAVHAWIRRNYDIPDLCERCKSDPPYDLANITGVYNRDRSNWMFLCRKCHMISDGRLEKFRRHYKTC